MKTMNNTYELVSEHYENAQLTPEQACEYDYLVQCIEDGEIDADDFGTLWQVAFPNF